MAGKCWKIILNAKVSEQKLFLVKSWAKTIYLCAKIRQKNFLAKFIGLFHIESFNYNVTGDARDLKIFVDSYFSLLETTFPCFKTILNIHKSRCMFVWSVDSSVYIGQGVYLSVPVGKVYRGWCRSVKCISDGVDFFLCRCIFLNNHNLDYPNSAQMFQCEQLSQHIPF